ncbi:MAG: hypothetical protein U9N44_01970 [Chloroflexota bacterium]|nr:hypothetical protein [Chloroflexota bacterium]
MRNLKYLLVFMLALIMLVGTTAPVFADSGKVDYSNQAVQKDLFSQMQKAKDIDSFIANLPPEGQKTAIELLKVVKIEKVTTTSITPSTSPTGIRSAAATGGIKTGTVEVYAKNSLGMKLWSYYESITFGYDGTTITRADQPRIWGQTYIVGWRYEGVLSSSTSGGVGYTFYEGWTQGHFILGIGGWDIKHCYPQIDITVYGNGGWSYWGSV